MRPVVSRHTIPLSVDPSAAAPSPIFQAPATFCHLHHTIKTPGGGSVKSQEVCRDERKSSANRSYKEDESGDGVGLVCLYDVPQAKDKDDERHQQSHRKVDQNLHQHPEDVLGKMLVASHGTKANEHRVPHRLPLGKTFSAGEILPETVRDLPDANFREEPCHILGVAHSRISLSSDFVPVAIRAKSHVRKMV